MEPKLKQLLQVGIFVKNADEIVKNYESMGMGPWEVSVMNGDTLDLYVNGERYYGEFIKVCILKAYGIEFELIEPIGPSPIKDWVEERGNGIHHLAFVTADNYEDVLNDYRRQTGREVWARGQGHNGLMDFSYLDLREELGVFVECYRNVLPDRPRQDF